MLEECLPKRLSAGCHWAMNARLTASISELRTRCRPVRLSGGLPIRPAGEQVLAMSLCAYNGPSCHSSDDALTALQLEFPAPDGAVGDASFLLDSVLILAVLEKYANLFSLFTRVSASHCYGSLTARGVDKSVDGPAASKRFGQPCHLSGKKRDRGQSTKH